MTADATTATDGQQPAGEVGDDATPYSRTRLTLGIVGRAWLWFVGGCLAVTLLPMLFGWRPYVVQSGSMEPRINVGDVILAAPENDPQELLGRVAVFTDPVFRDHPKAHRVIGVNTDGTLTTKGDANITADTSPVPSSDVRGLARLLVEFVGLPLIWMWSGQWLFVLLFLASLVLAARFVARDHEDDLEPEDDDADGGPTDGDVVPFPSAPGGSPSTQIAASKPLGDTLRRVASGAGRRLVSSPRWVTRTAYVAVLASAVLLPTAGAAFAATSRNTSETWTVANWNYTSDVLALNPWLYWKLDDTGNSAFDTSGNGRAGTYTPGTGTITKNVVGALTTDTPNLAVTMSGNSCIYTTSTTTMNAPTQLTEIVWFKTTSTNGGKLLGFEMPRTGVGIPGNGGTYDRHLYMDGAGKVWFGVYNGGYFTIGSPGTYNDGQWHMAAASMGAGGMTLYIDGTAVGTNANTTGETTTGWFRAGCGNLGGWGGSWTGNNNPTTNTDPTQNRPFAGSLDEVSIWQSVLTAAQIRSLYIAK
ncbi:MAG: signal peptidase I [Candidatus Nanopelagicales bacterium]